MYQVTEKDLIGELKGFPLEVVQKMIEEQVKQGNEADVKVFQENVAHSIHKGGFRWSRTEEGQSFWSDVVFDKNFNLFFEKYPKQIEYHNPEFALQQFIGFVAGRRGEGVTYLVEAMGLSKREWEEIKDDCIFDNGNLREDLEEYFKNK